MPDNSASGGNNATWRYRFNPAVEADLQDSSTQSSVALGYKRESARRSIRLATDVVVATDANAPRASSRQCSWGNAVCAQASSAKVRHRRVVNTRTKQSIRYAAHRLKRRSRARKKSARAAETCGWQIDAARGRGSGRAGIRVWTALPVCVYMHLPQALLHKPASSLCQPAA